MTSHTHSPLPAQNKKNSPSYEMATTKPLTPKSDLSENSNFFAGLCFGLGKISIGNRHSGKHFTNCNANYMKMETKPNRRLFLRFFYFNFFFILVYECLRPVVSAVLCRMPLRSLEAV